MRILWAILCQDVIVSESGSVAGIFNPLSAYIFEGRPDISQTPYAIPNSQVHAVLMLYNDSDLQDEFSVSVAFLPPTGSKIASGGNYFHNFQIAPGQREIFHLALAPLYYEIDGDYEVVFNAFYKGGQLNDFTTLIDISAID